MKKILTALFVASLLTACNTKTMENPMTTDPVQKEENSNIQMIEQIAEVRLTVPDSRWSLEIVNVTETKGEIAILCQLTQSDMMGMMVISEVVDAVKFVASNKPQHVYIKGKTWNWENDEDYTFVSPEDILRIRDGERIEFSRVEPSQPGGPKKQML